jgi:hypothetical protein
VLKSSDADRLIARDFLESCHNVRRALAGLNRYEFITERKPASYWYALLRHLWLDHIKAINTLIDQFQPVRVCEFPTEEFVLVIHESPHPLKSILNFLLVTLHLSFYRIGPMLERVLALLNGKKGPGLHHGKEMSVLRSAQRLQVLSY